MVQFENSIIIISAIFVLCAGDGNAKRRLPEQSPFKYGSELQGLLSSFHNVLHQHGSGNSTDTAGNGGVSSGLGLSSSLVHVADDLAFSGDIDAHVDDDLAFAQPLLSHQTSLAAGDDDDVSSLGVLGSVLGEDVALGGGSVTVQSQQSGGTANHQGVANDTDVLALQVDVVVVQDLHAGLSGAGSVAQIVTAFVNAGVGQVVHGVNVLAGIQQVADLVLISSQVLGQGTEHQAAVDGGIFVNLLDHGDQLFLGAGLGQNEVHDLDAQSLSALGCASLVRQVGTLLTDADNSQGGVNALFLQGRL